MPKFTPEVRVSTILEALSLPTVPAGCDLEERDLVEIEVEIDQGEVDDEATEEEPERIETDPHDLRDGLRSLIAGDFAMASILLHRAFDEDTDAQRVVEEEIRLAIRKKAA